LVKMEITDPERAHLRMSDVGFHHFAKTALPDCPENYADHPDFAHPKGRNTANREQKRNRKVLATPNVKEEVWEVVRFLMQRVTKKKQIPGDVKKILKRIMRQQDYIRGLAEYYELAAYVPVLMLGWYMREAIVPDEDKKAQLARNELRDLPFLVGGRRMPKLRKGEIKAISKLKVMWCATGIQILDYTSVNAEPRKLKFPARMALCSVEEKGNDVRYNPIPNTVSKKPIMFEISVPFARGIIEQRVKREKKRWQEVKQLTYRHKARSSKALRPAEQNPLQPSMFPEKVA
jgi:hypothetical protein